MRIVVLITLLEGCNPSKVAPSFITYSEVKKVFDFRCHSCHNSTNNIGNWSDYNQAYNKKDEIYDRVWINRTMPLGPITEPERELIRDWILTGANK